MRSLIELQGCKKWVIILTKSIKLPNRRFEIALDRDFSERPPGWEFPRELPTF